MQKNINNIFIFKITVISFVIAFFAAIFFIYQNIVLQSLIKDLTHIRFEYSSLLNQISEDKKKNTFL